MSNFRHVLELPSPKSLPADPDAAAAAVVALLEQSTLDLDEHDEHLLKCDGRYFMIMWGAGRDLIEVSPPAIDWSGYEESDRRFEHALDATVDDLLSLEYYIQDARMTERPGISRNLQMLFITLAVAILITVVGALADDGMARCQAVASFDICFTALNR